MKQLGVGIPFVGVTRFSVYSPQNSGLNTSAKHGDDSSSYIKELYSADRIESRLQIFGEVAAPVYQQFANSSDYTHLVQYSKEMPEQYKSRLFEISRKYPAVKPVLVSGESMDETVRKFVKTWDPAFNGVFVWLRVDDDDVLSIDYLHALGKHARIENAGTAVSFSTVMVAQYACGRFLNFRQTNLPKNSIGQAYISYANVNSGIVDTPQQYPHHRIDEFIPLILDPRGIRGLQVRHAWQDTSNSNSKIGHRIAHRSFELGKLPNVNAAHALQKFPTLSKSIRDLSLSSKAEVRLEVGEWVDVADKFELFEDGRTIEFNWNAEFMGQPDNGASLSIDFSVNELADGHFPSDEPRGNYRRLHVNSEGYGENFLVFPTGTKPVRMRLNADGEKKDVKAAWLRFYDVGVLG